jgi:hypothetical protein
MKTKSKYRVKVLVEEPLFGSPITRYMIQKHTIFGWMKIHEPTGQKDWAYRTCEEMNTDYETIRTQIK